MPPSILDGLGERLQPEKAEAVRNSAIGNGFHIPSVMMAFVLLFQLAPAAATVGYSMTDIDEDMLRQRVSGTPFDTQTLVAHPRIIKVPTLIEDMQLMLPMLPATHAAWAKASSSLCLVDTAGLQCFSVYLHLRGEANLEQGPFWRMQKHRARTAASLGHQRAVADSRRGLDHMFPPGLGIDQHIKSATTQGSPFECSDNVDDDLQFGADLLAVFGPRAQTWRELQRTKLQLAFDALEPLRHELASARSITAQAVAASRDVPALALLTALLRWPDREQPAAYLHGFPVVGNIQSSGVFRSVTPPVIEDLHTSFYGEPAVQEVQELLASPPSKDAAEIFDLTEEEIQRGFTEPLVTARELDARFGVGRWRPLYRFLVRQGDGKVRPIDDGRRGKQNSFSSLAETIYTISVDVVPAWAACVVRACQQEGKAGASPDELPDWLHLDIGTEDLPDAFRGCPLLPEHQPAVVVAIWHPHKAAWRFGVMLGCPIWSRIGGGNVQPLPHLGGSSPAPDPRSPHWGLLRRYPHHGYRSHLPPGEGPW